MPRRWAASVALAGLLVGAAALTGFAVAGTPIEPGAQALLERWIKAMGGGAALSRIATIRQLGVVEGAGVSGDLDEWLTARGEHRQFIDFLGRWNVLTLYDGRRGWSVDAEGVRHVLRGHELAAEVTDTYLATWGWLRPGSHPARFELLDPRPVRNEFRLRITPERGLPATVTLDATSGLPLRWEMPVGERTRLTVPLDWRVVDGVLVPFGFRQSTGDIRTDVVVTLREVRFGDPPPPDAFSPPAGPPPDIAFASGDSAVGLPLVILASRPTIEARLNGAGPYRFVLDTAALHSVLGEPVVAAAGLTEQVDTTGVATGDAPRGGRRVVGPVVLDLGGASWREARFGLARLDELGALLGRPVDGILGVDFCERFVLRVDPVAGRLDLHDPGSYVPGPGGESVPLRRVRGLPSLEFGVDGRATIRGLLRTNMRLPIVLTPGFAEALLNPPGGPPPIQVPLGRPFDPAALSTLNRFQRVTLGGLTVTGVPAAAPPPGHLPPLGTELAGLVGGELLERFAYRLDLGREELTLWPLSSETPFAFDASGLRLNLLPGAKPAFGVAWVMPGSPAAEAGLVVGDALDRIDGRKAAEWTLDALEKRLQRSGDNCSVEGRRAGSTFKTRLALRALL